jgi:hypothetical protein
VVVADRAARRGPVVLVLLAAPEDLAMRPDRAAVAQAAKEVSPEWAVAARVATPVV